MNEFVNELYNKIGQTGSVLIAIAIMLIAGFLLTRFCKILGLPYVSGYIVAGILIGPNILKLVPSHIISGMDFVLDIALAFIAFGVGRFFKFDVLKKTGTKVILVTLIEALLAGILITFSLYFIFNLTFEFALILGAIATATAPASTTMTIRQYNVKGKFVDTLLQVIALDNVLCLFVFSIITAICGETGVSNNLLSIVLPIIYNIAMLVVALVFGLLLKVINANRSSDSKIILLLATLLIICGMCAVINVSPLLSCMMLGMVYINTSKDESLFQQANDFAPPILCLFFVLSGMNLDITALSSVGLIGVTYFLIRIIGKVLGTMFGLKITKFSPEIVKYMGLAMIPQAGVAIGLAFLAKRMLPVETGELMLTIILSSSVLYELIGPVCAKLGMKKAGVLKDTTKQVIIAPDNTNPIISIEDIVVEKKTDIDETNLEELILDEDINYEEDD